MFLSRRVTGIRALVFHCLEAQLRRICLLHGLQVDAKCAPRDMKLLLFSTVTASVSNVSPLSPLQTVLLVFALQLDSCLL